MMNNNKILTVSYGTFSCTLEGFDDSFGTMKAIAEYFRDLAADDRYFGAEPPQPDADMLARIAQKEVSRRVQAREQDGKIVLSAIEDQTAPVRLAATAGAAASDPVKITPDVAETDVVETATSAPEVEEAPVEVATAAAAFNVPELDAAQDIIIEEIEEAAQSPDVAVAQAVIAETVAAEPEASAVEAVDNEAVDDIAAAEPEFIEDENDIVPGQADADVEAFFADSPKAQDDTSDEDDAATAEIAPVEQAAPVEPVKQAPAAPAPDSIAAKLQRIRAVVAQHEETDDEDDYLEDEHAEAGTSDQPTADADDVIADARADIEDALEADAAIATDAIEDAEDEPSEEDDVSAILSRLENLTQDTPAPVLAPTPDAQDVSDALQDVPLVEQDIASDEPTVEDTISNLFDDEAGLAGDADDTAAPAKVSLRKTPRVILAEDHVSTDKAPAEAEKPASRARVIKVKRADLEAAIDKGDLEEYGDDTDDFDDVDAIEEATKAETRQAPKLDDLAPSRGKKRTALSPEDEAELARELAELEVDAAEEPQETVAPTRPVRRADAARHTLPAIDESTEVDVNRLLAETDHQMDEPESATRRDAFAHLRAAVAAKKADVAMGGKGQDEDSDGAYREDLAEVVRPRRPTSTATRTERPAEARPAPLKLVAEQRIDVQKPVANAGPVRPRRISAAAEEALPGPDGESFTDFAADMGASTLPQLLEAAAAYMSFVEGRDQFSRPQLMTKVRQAGGPDGFSREEGLRSFGQLLRAGKIEKIKGGRFTVSDDIGYRPDERAAG
jgi:hypothetical protein